MKRLNDKLIAGIDLHSNNLMIGIIDLEGKRVVHRKLDCNLKEVIAFLAPHKSQMQSMAVESTFNWYWLVDGLREAGYPIDLANPAQIQQYSGLKHADDKDDAYYLAELQRLKILPTAHVYDPALRPVRDLLRRRTKLVHQRTSLMLSFKSLFARTTGEKLELKELKKLQPKQAVKLYEHPANQLIAGIQSEHIENLIGALAALKRQCWPARASCRCMKNCSLFQESARFWA